MSDSVTLEQRLRKLEATLEALASRERATAIAGIFTPAIAGDGTPGTFTYDATLTTGEYTRQADWCFFSARVVITATSVAPTGNLSMIGLPITSGASASNLQGGATIYFWNTFNLAAGYTHVAGQITAGVTVMGIMKNGDNVGAIRVQGSEMNATLDLRVVGSYRVA